MEIKQYWNLFWKWKWFLIVGIVLAAGTAYVVSRSMTPVYQTSTRLLVTPGSPQSTESYASLVASERLAQTYAQLLKSEPLVQETYRRLGRTVSTLVTKRRAVSLPGPLGWFNPIANQALGMVGLAPSAEPSAGADVPEMSFMAEPVRDTQILILRVEGTDPQSITAAANTLVDVFIEWQKGVQQSRYVESKAKLTAGMERLQADIAEMEAAIQALEADSNSADSIKLTRLQDQLAQYRNNYTALLNSYSTINLAEANSGATISVISPAVRPNGSIRPKVMQNTLLAALLGGMLALGVVFLVEYLDDTVKTQADLHTADLNLLAVVQRVAKGGKNGDEGLYAVSQPRSMVTESYRTLRTNLQFSSLDKPLRILVVTSALAAEGKTTTAANLAVVLAQDGKRVVLVDADLRRPNAHRLFGMPNRTGLTKALVDDPAALFGYVRDTEVENLKVLTAGPVPPNPQELLGSQRMADILEKLRATSDIVVVDTPPALAVADANVLATRADGVLLVVFAGQTRRAALQQAAEGLSKVGAHLVGGVLNMVPTRKGGGYHYQYYYYYSDYREDSERLDKRKGEEVGQSGQQRRRRGSQEGQVEPARGRS